jgi:hypothetical protein
MANIESKMEVQLPSLLVKRKKSILERVKKHKKENSIFERITKRK